MSDTKVRILAAAEKIILKQGLQAASLRAITAKAKVNIAAINYHFGCKENLIREVFARFILPLDKERTRLLEEARAGAGDAVLPVEDVVRAFLVPWFSFKQEHQKLINTFAALYSNRSRADRPFKDLIQEIARQAYGTFTDAIAAALPEVPRETLLLRTNLAIVTAAGVVLNDWLTESLAAMSGGPIQEKDLIAFVVNVIEAPGDSC